MATLAAVVGHELPANTAHDSHDLLPVWKHNAPSPRRSIVHNTFADVYAIRHDQWVLIAARSGATARSPRGSTRRIITGRTSIPASSTT